MSTLKAQDRFANAALTLVISLSLVIVCAVASWAQPTQQVMPQNGGTDSMNTIRQQFFASQYGKYIPYAKPVQWGGHAQYDPKTGQPTPGFVQGSYLTAHNGIPMYTNYPPTPMPAFFNFPTDTTAEQWRYYQNMMPSTGGVISDTQYQAYTTKVLHDTVANLTDPGRLTPAAMSMQQAQAGSAANALGDVARNQASSAIDFSSKYLINFTTDGGNIWNRIRNQLFVPIGILLLLPGAVLSQVKAIMNAGNPVMDDPLLGAANPFDGILRAIIAIFLIPASYLIVNYGIDVSNSITLTIAGAYTQNFGDNMYKAAECAQIRANPVRQAAENNNNYSATTANMRPLLNSKTTRGNFEGNTLETKIEDPCAGISIAPADRVDEAMSFGNTATRLLANGMNAGLTTTWNLLCAFMMAYLMYLFFVGPVIAALYAWPMQQLRSAFPSWVEGTITICFWSLFWNTVILMMACFKGVDETGTLIMTALNFLATASVQYAFDFASLVKAAGQQAGQQAGSKSKGASGSKGTTGATGAKGAPAKPSARPVTIAAKAAKAASANSRPGSPQLLGSASPISFSPSTPTGGSSGSSDGQPDPSDPSSVQTTSAMVLTPSPFVSASTPAGANKMAMNIGLPPMISGQPVEKYMLPNGDSLSISRDAESGLATVKDQNGGLIGSFDPNSKGANYYRLMNGDMLQIARNGNSDVLSLTANGQTQTLHATTGAPVQRTQMAGIFGGVTGAGLSGTIGGGFAGTNGGSSATSPNLAPQTENSSSPGLDGALNAIFVSQLANQPSLSIPTSVAAMQQPGHPNVTVTPTAPTIPNGASAPIAIGNVAAFLLPNGGNKDLSATQPAANAGANFTPQHDSGPIIGTQPVGSFVDRTAVGANQFHAVATDGTMPTFNNFSSTELAKDNGHKQPAMTLAAVNSPINSIPSESWQTPAFSGQVPDHEPVSQILHEQPNSLGRESAIAANNNSAWREAVSAASSNSVWHESPSATPSNSVWHSASSSNPVWLESPSAASINSVSHESVNAASNNSISHESINAASNNSISHESVNPASNNSIWLESPSASSSNSVSHEPVNAASNNSVWLESPSAASINSVSHESSLSAASSNPVWLESPSGASNNSLSHESVSAASNNSVWLESPSAASNNSVSHESVSAASNNSVWLESHSIDSTGSVWRNEPSSKESVWNYESLRMNAVSSSNSTMNSASFETNSTVSSSADSSPQSLGSSPRPETIQTLWFREDSGKNSIDESASRDKRTYSCTDSEQRVPGQSKLNSVLASTFEAPAYSKRIDVQVDRSMKCSEDRQTSFGNQTPNRFKQAAHGLEIGAPNARSQKDATHTEIQKSWYAGSDEVGAVPPCTKCSGGSCDCPPRQTTSKLSKALGFARTNLKNDQSQNTAELSTSVKKLLDKTNRTGGEDDRDPKSFAADERSTQAVKCQNCIGLLCSCMGVTQSQQTVSSRA